ncbi:unnamed protein product [Rotaria sordida]|uniref:ABC transporter domain-containing protein n=1 Tax=Rotaria sordida TaxID=392033 RepID=A0A815EQZ8_9BILA|nr:unnamed protein product [Rotaria sordida]
MNCTDAKIRSQGPNEDEDNKLFQNKTVNNVIVRFDSPSTLKTGRALAYNIMVRMPNLVPRKNDPTDISFLAYNHPTQISDRSNSTPHRSDERYEWPEFADIKIFVDSLLISYQTNNDVKLELERKPISCTPYRSDVIYSRGLFFVYMILGFVDLIFLIPFIILLVGLIQEKNNKVKEILKILGIEPILNNIAHAIRPFIAAHSLFQQTILHDIAKKDVCILYWALAWYLEKVFPGFGRNKERIASKILRLVDLEESKNLYCNALSGGMKRRLSLACAFVGDTKIVLLDEPSSGVDPAHRQSLLEWLRMMKEGKTILLATHLMEESDVLSDRIMILVNGNIKVHGTPSKLKRDYGVGYKIIINKSNDQTNDIENQLRPHLRELTIERDTSGGDIVICTNEKMSSHFVDALEKLEAMKEAKQIRNYGVQNSSMEDVFLKIVRDAGETDQSETTTINIEQIASQCRHVLNNRQLESDFKFYLSQFYGLAIKTIRVRYRRWGLAVIFLLLPIFYNVLFNSISQSQQDVGIYQMKHNALSPQTIIYQADSTIENFLRAALDSKSKLFKGSGRNLSEMHDDIRQQRLQRPYTYTDIYLGLHVPKPNENTYTMQVLSSNLISGYEVLSLASDTFFKRAINETSAKIQTTLAYRKTENFTLHQPPLGDIMNSLSTASCTLKFLPTSLLFEIFLYYIIFFYTTIFLIGERKDNFLSLLNISGLHPALYWLFNYIFDILLSVIWFCYLLAIYRIVDVAFNGTVSSQSATLLSLVTFSEPVKLRTQFYSLTILIALPTLPFVYLLTKVFRNDILLIVRDLVKFYPARQTPIVNHLTFGARRGEIFGLLGHNGAGKTTTFRIVVGELMATEGMAFIGGQNVCRRRLTSTCHLGYCPQQNCSMDFLTVRDSLYLFARIRGVPRERIDSMVSNMISLFLLDEYVNNYTHQLSGGTKRRLHAAIALIGPPLVAILDEPTTGVDPYAQQQIQEVLLNAVKSQMTIILTSHSMDEW